ncbi:MAG: hypothetical protein IPK16_27500 [Anaerolineales bacterium]|nr:hypothetical protein [Anaerolineales bacterium]
MSEPKRIVTVVTARRVGHFAGSALAERPGEIEAVIIAHVPGCPPKPEEILRALGRWSGKAFLGKFMPAGLRLVDKPE